MKRSKQAALTAAVFAAAIGSASAGSTASALTAFSPESQQIAAVLYGPPPVQGDIDTNRKLDARDITMLKRHLMKTDSETGKTQIAHIAYYETDYQSNWDFDSDRVLDKSDVSSMINHLTGNALPVRFTAYVYPLAYLPDSTLTEDEQKKLLRKADRLLPGPYRITVRCGDSEWTQDTEAYLVLCRGIPVELFQSAEIPEEPGTEHVRKATVRLELNRLSDAYADDASDRAPFEFEISYVTSARDADSNLILNDRCVVECDIVGKKTAFAGNYKVSDVIAEPEGIEEQYERYCDVLDEKYIDTTDSTE